MEGRLAHAGRRSAAAEYRRCVHNRAMGNRLQWSIHDADRLWKLQELTDAALAHLELDALLPTLLLRTRQVLGVDTCAVLLLDEETNELVARAAVGLEEEVERGVRIPVGRGFAGRVAAARHPVILDDVDRADVLNPLLREKGIKSMLGVPLIVGGHVLGVLHVGVLTHRVFNEQEWSCCNLRVTAQPSPSSMLGSSRRSARRDGGLSRCKPLRMRRLPTSNSMTVRRASASHSRHPRSGHVRGAPRR